MAKNFVQGAAIIALKACNYLEKSLNKPAFVAAVNVADPTLVALIPSACACEINDAKSALYCDITVSRAIMAFCLLAFAVLTASFASSRAAFRLAIACCDI